MEKTRGKPEGKLCLSHKQNIQFIINKISTAAGSTNGSMGTFQPNNRDVTCQKFCAVTRGQNFFFAESWGMRDFFFKIHLYHAGVCEGNWEILKHHVSLP